MPHLFFGVESGIVYDFPGNEVPVDTSGRVITDQMIPLAEFVAKQVFPFNKGDYPLPERSMWSTEIVMKLGRKVVEDLAELNPPVALTKPIINHLYVLGIFPHSTYFLSEEGRFNGLTDYRSRIGAQELVQNVRQMHDRNIEYGNLSVDELAELLLDRYNAHIKPLHKKQHQGPLTTDVIKELNQVGLAPSDNYIHVHLGGLRRLNEALGFPDIYSWTDEDFIAYGADVIRYNGKSSLTVDTINTLASYDYGPRYGTIRTRLGWNTFTQQATKEYERQDIASQKYHRIVTDYYAEHVARSDAKVTFDEMAIYRGFHILAEHYGISKSKDIRQISQQAIEGLKRQICSERHVSEAELETNAIMIQVYDDLWPPARRKRPPILSLIK